MFLRNLAVAFAFTLLSVTTSDLLAQDPPRSAPAAAPPATTPPPGAPGSTAMPPGAIVAPDAPRGNRITGIETNREMIAAEAPTDIVVNGMPGANCGLAIDFGDGAKSTHAISDASPFPLRVAHTYAKTAELTVRAAGAADGANPPCEGALEAAIHISPAGSKIEYITLPIDTCPEGWSMVGQINADKSFKCTPVADMSAPTNLIHCTGGMKYFARGGNVGCGHPGSFTSEVADKMASMKKMVKGGMKSASQKAASVKSAVAASVKSKAASDKPGSSKAPVKKPPGKAKSVSGADAPN